MIYDVGNAVLPFVGGFTVRSSRTALTVRCMYGVCTVYYVYTLTGKEGVAQRQRGKPGN